MIKTSIKETKPKTQFKFPILMKLKCDGRIVLFLNNCEGILVSLSPDVEKQKFSSVELFDVSKSWVPADGEDWDIFTDELTLKNA